MANGQLTTSALQGAATGAAAGPIGAGLGAAVGYGIASLGGLFGGKKKKKAPAVAKPPPAPSHTGLYVTIGVTAGVVVIGSVALILIARR